MKKTILCHFYNEEYMLPWFLAHHKKIFDHGVMIDYHSTDKSVEIIKKICPSWDIITSKNFNFQADKIDEEVFEIENSIEGWKICLNATEQLIGNYSLLTDKPQQLLIPSIFFVDCDREIEVNYEMPLYNQKTYGFTFENYFIERRARSLHNIYVKYPTYPTRECMGPGRHFNMYNTKELAIFYYGWCPFNRQQLKRKLQIQTQIPEIDRQRGWGSHHITDEKTLTYRLENEFIPKSTNLKEVINYYVTKHKNFSNIL